MYRLAAQGACGGGDPGVESMIINAAWDVIDSTPRCAIGKMP